MPPCLRSVATALALAVLAACLASSCQSFSNFFKGGSGDDSAAEDMSVAQEGAAATGSAEPESVAADPRETVFLATAAGAAATGSGETAVGDDDWLFSRAELGTLSRRPEAGSPAFSSAVTAVAEYHRQLAGRGITLVVVPAPPKAFIYPEQISPDSKISRRQVERFDSYLRTVYASLRQQGVLVADPTDAMLDQRYDKTGRMFPHTDRQWAPRAAELAAAQAAAVLKSSGVLADVTPEPGMVAVESTVTLQGDLAPAGAAPETLPARRVGTGSAESLAPLSHPSSSPVIVLGGPAAGAPREDGGTASFANQLAYELRIPVDTIIADSSRNIPRSRFLRAAMTSPASVRGKRAVVWVIDAAEFYENDWRQVPVSLELRRSEEELRRAGAAPTDPPSP